jgi:hypothetical protein
MRKKTIIIFACSLVLCATALLNVNTYSNPSGAPSGSSGAPNDPANGCARSGCHNATPTTRVGLLTSDIPTDGYIAGQTYTFTAQITQAGISKWGFQATAQNNSGTALGTLILTNTGQTRFPSGSSGSKYVTHSTGGNSGSTGSKTWTFDWTAPAAGTGPVTFYIYAMAANNNGNESGDQVFKETVTYQELTGVGMSAIKPLSMELYPNPSSIGFFSIKGLKEGTNLVKMFDSNGKLVFNQTLLGTNQNIFTNGFEKGVYFVSVESKSGNAFKKLIIQ